MRGRFRMWGTVLALVLAAAPTSAAQEVAFEAALADSVVVTATREASDARTTGRRVTVWTARELAVLPVASFDELLRTVGGVEVQSRGGFGVQSDLTMRGSTFNGVLVLLDGARLNDPMTGHFLADVPVPVGAIARIEVLRGPAAALYGPDALGGVIQLFTYTGLRDAGGPATGVDGAATLEGGSHATGRAEAALRSAGRRTAAGAAAVWQRSDGERIEDADGRVVRGPGGPVRTDFDRRAATASVAHDLGGPVLYARAGLDDRDFGAYRFYTPFASDTAREATRTYWAQARLRGTRGATRWTAQVHAKQHEDVYVYNPQTPANEHTSRLAVAQAHAARTLRPGLDLTAGASLSARGIDSNNLGRHDDLAGGGFVLARWHPGAGLTLHGSLRVDADPGYGVEPTPQLHAAYTRGAVTLRGGAARAVRAPTYVERYINTTLASPRGRSLGNPALRAESAWAYEAGMDVYPADGLALHVTAFHRATDDLIDYVQQTPQDTVFLARNLLSVRTRGAEVDAALDRPLGAARLRLQATYTWLDADLGDVAPGVTTKYALTNARHLVQANASVDAGPLTLGLGALWKDRLAGDAYGTVDARLAYRLPVAAARVAVTGEVRNVFDADYAERFDAPMPGRWWLFGLRWQR